MIDTHCHLDAAEFAFDRDAVVHAAHSAGVVRLVVPAVSVANFAAVDDCVERYPACAAAFGIHPLYVATAVPEDIAVLRRRLCAGGAVAVGEIGLDYFTPGIDPARQGWFLAEQLKLAREFDLPVLLHVRRAVDAVLLAVRRAGVRGGIAHAFNGSRQQADAFIALGFRLGFGGAMTYPGSSRIRALARDLPLSAIVLETDAPDIPPHWLAGRRNQPAELARIAHELAVLRGIDVTEVVAETSAAARAALPGL